MGWGAGTLAALRSAAARADGASFCHFSLHTPFKHGPTRRYNPASPLGAGGLTISFFLLPRAPSSPSGRGYPCPYPLPWTWTGGAASGQSVQDGPRQLQEERFSEPKMR